MNAPIILIVLIGNDPVEYSVSIDNYSHYECKCGKNNIETVLNKSINHLLESYENPNINIVSSGTDNNYVSEMCKKYIVSGISRLNNMKEFFYMNQELFREINAGENKIIKLPRRRNKIIIQRH